MKRAKASAHVKKVKQALGQTPSVLPGRVDVSESFRRARLSIADITADLQHLRRSPAGAVKRARPTPKAK